MRFNKQELTTLATQPSQKFEKEGTLYIRERQEGFFRRSETSLERWCRLRGNLLFYFKSREQWSEPLGVIILEHCTFGLDESSNESSFGFNIVFEGGLSQRLGANSSDERDAWLQALQLASYECMRNQLLALRQRIEARSGHKHDTDIHMLRLQRGIITDPAEIPVCEISVACDNLLCDGHGRPPNPVLEIDVEANRTGTWIKYARTEIIERSSNPSFLTTVSFRASDGLTTESKVRVTAYDVRERVSQTATPIGSAIVSFSAVQDTPRLRIPLKSLKSTTVGFLTINVWNLEAEDKENSTEGTPSRTVPGTTNSSQIMSHRRSHSLPPRLGTKIKLPHQGQLKFLFANPHVQTYRFHSGLGGDICVHEIMAESKLCFQFPQQLLGIWIQEEKELLQEIAGMGELREPWHTKQVQLLDRHLHLLHLYSQANENLSSFKGSYFKRSTRKKDRTLEFAPVNLHLQRMWVHNDTLNKCGFYDFITVGAFTAHSHKSKNGGLIRLVQALKESPSRHLHLYQGSSKIQMARDAIEAIKQLRRDVVEAMRSLMKLARDKETSGMLPICEDMISKTRILLSLWDPGLVEEALTFLEEHKLATLPEQLENDHADLRVSRAQEHQDQRLLNRGSGDGVDYGPDQSLSPFKRITRQLNFDSKSLDFDDLISPETPECLDDPWSRETAVKELSSISRSHESDADRSYDHEEDFVLFPEVETDGDQRSGWSNDDCYGSYSRRGSNTSCLVTGGPSESLNTNGNSVRNNDDRLGTDEPVGNGAEEQDDSDYRRDEPEEIDIGKRFLDTQKMCNSPSANYYKPTDEPEPWDLTQLNIEASVMCLVSKVKFLCGRCSSPAVRLRNKNAIGITRNLGGYLASTNRSGINPVVTIQPKNGAKGDSESCKLLNKNAHDESPRRRFSSQQQQQPSQSPARGGECVVGGGERTTAGFAKAKEVCQAVDTMTRVIKSNSSGQRNKFTEGLDFASIVDWTCELRPSMKKLRQAMDGLLKTARLTHSVFRVQEDSKRAQRACNVRYRRDVCFSQALTALVTALMAKLWCQRPDPLFLLIVTTLGPLASFEGLLSYYGNEIDMWGDMAVAVEDTHTVTFTLSRCGINSRIEEGMGGVAPEIPLPRVVGSRTALTVMLPVPDGIYSLLPLVPSSRQSLSFNVTPVFFNIGINEKATLAETLGTTGPQERSNLDNFDRLNEYYLRFKKLNLPCDSGTGCVGARSPINRTLADTINDLKTQVQTKVEKNTSVLRLSSEICRRMRALRFTSCKSGKDRTGMSITLEQVNILAGEYHLSEYEFLRALDCMRSEGCRRENTWKNIGARRYTFKSTVSALPKLYRPPTGTYG